MVGRASTVGMTLLGLAWIPVIQTQKGNTSLRSSEFYSPIHVGMRSSQPNFLKDSYSWSLKT